MSVNLVNNAQILEIRNALEQTFGQFEIGQIGDKSPTSCYIGIHLDERDGLFKQWFTASTGALKIPSKCGNEECNVSLSTNFEGASSLLKILGQKTPQFPPLELPSTEQLQFISHHVPDLFLLTCAIQNNFIQNELPPSPPKQPTQVTILDTRNVTFLTRDDSSADEIGFILPVYSLPMAKLSHA